MEKIEVSHLLRNNRVTLISEWEKEVRNKIKVAEGTYQTALVNTLPVFIENLADTMDLHQSVSLATEGSSVAIDHGIEKARLTAYTPEHIIQEYQILRLLICNFLKEHNLLNDTIKEIITLSIESACMHACRGFFDTFLSMREQFMLTLSHDLRNPLSIAKAAAQYIIQNPTDPTKNSNLGKTIDKSLDRIDRMIQSLLDVSRLRMGEELCFNFTQLDMTALLKEIMDEFTMTHGDRFTYSGPASIQGTWDQDAMKRVFENLLTNAVKYGAPNGPITISAEVIFEKAIIKVHNEGSYISDEDQKKLFNLFKQVRSHEGVKVKGWGIGLLLVKGVVEGHGGGVSINSHKDTGTTFVLSLPLDGSKNIGVSSHHGI